MSLDQLYQQIILEHAKARHGSGLAAADAPKEASCGQSHQLNPTCGDEITVRVSVAGGKVSELRWDGGSVDHRRDGHEDRYAEAVRAKLLDIQYGRTEDSHGWLTRLV